MLVTDRTTVEQPMRKLIIPALGAFALIAGLWSIGMGAAPDTDPVVSG